MKNGNVRYASEEQLDELRIAVQKSVNKLRGRIEATTAQGWIGNSAALDRFAEQLIPLPQAVCVEAPTLSYLRLIACGDHTTVPQTSGKRTIASSTGVFSHIDPDFTNYGCNVVANATDATPTEVYELTKNGTFAAIFGDFGRNLDDLCLTEDQIVSFVENHPRHLRTGGYGTFFLFKVDGAYFIAGVRLDSDVRWGVDVYRFSDDDVWGARGRHRVVVPQLRTSAVSIVC